MCMSAMCAMSCSGNMPHSVRFATVERCLWLAPLCLRGDKNNHREWAMRPSEKPIGRKGDRSSNRNYPLTTLPTPIPEFGVMPVVVMIFMIAIVLALAVRKSGT